MGNIYTRIIVSIFRRICMKIYEIKEQISDTNLIDNIYQINKLMQRIINQTEFIIDINKTDLDYINIVLDKIKINLQKIYYIILTSNT